MLPHQKQSMPWAILSRGRRGNITYLQPSPPWAIHHKHLVSRHIALASFGGTRIDCVDGEKVGAQEELVLYMFMRATCITTCDMQNDTWRIHVTAAACFPFYCHLFASQRAAPRTCHYRRAFAAPVLDDGTNQWHSF
jgi:hypothetical protein